MMLIDEILHHPIRPTYCRLTIVQVSKLVQDFRHIIHSKMTSLWLPLTSGAFLEFDMEGLRCSSPDVSHRLNS